MENSSDFNMWCMFLFSIFAVSVHPQEVYNLSVVELAQLLEEVVQEREGDVNETDVTFYISTRKNSESAKQITKRNTNQVDVDKLTKFIIHGWLENYKVGWYSEIKDELLKYEDVNVIYVDWERVAKSFYISSAKNTKLVGNIIGRFIVDNKIPSRNVHLIGHSLGSHVAGFASKFIKKNIGATVMRISALDPAGPYFRLPDRTEDEKLDRKDAEIVDVIHTDAKFFGLDQPVGTLDIYVNGGSRRQPGCNDGQLSFNFQEIMKNTLCSHSRSHEYFIQSINNAIIICDKCHSYENMKNKECSSREVYRIVHQNITKDMKGVCSVYTDSDPPYFVYQ